MYLPFVTKTLVSNNISGLHHVGTFGTVNPFSSGPAVPAPVGTASNLFQQQAAAQAARPSINQIRQQPFGSSGTAQPSSGFVLPQPLQPNPFLS